MVVRIGPGIDPGWLIAAVGVGLEVVGWYQISGQPTEAQQLPYLASATIPGAALIVAGAVLIASRRRVEPRGGVHGTYAAAGVIQRAGLWALPDGSYVHRGDCPLLDGKPDVYEVTGADAGRVDRDGTRGGGGASADTSDGSAGTGTSAGTSATPAPARPCPICEPDLAAVTQ